MNIEDKMQLYIENGDIDNIEQVFNSGYIPVQCLLMNGSYRTEYMNIHEYNNSYYEDFNAAEYDFFVDNWNRSLEWWLYIYNHDLNVYMKNDIDCQFSEKPTKNEYKKLYEND